MIEFLWNDIVAHTVIYLLLLFLMGAACISLYHVFWACWRARNKQKALFVESRKDREEMQKILESLKKSQEKCPLFK